MKNATLGLLALLCLCFPLLASAAPVPQDCAEVRLEMQKKMGTLDSVLKVRTAYLLGEIKQSGPAIRQCLSENASVTVRAFLLWVTSGVFLLVLMGLTFWNGRVNRKAIRTLSKCMHHLDPSHPETYQPNQWSRNLQWGVLILCFICVNLVALLF